MCKIMKKYGSFFNMDKMSTSAFRLNDINSLFLPGMLNTCFHMAQKDVDNDGNWKIFLDKDCCEAVQRTLDNISLCIHIKTLHILEFNYIMSVQI